MAKVGLRADKQSVTSGTQSGGAGGLFVPYMSGWDSDGQYNVDEFDASGNLVAQCHNVAVVAGLSPGSGYNMFDTMGNADGHYTEGSFTAWGGPGFMAATAGGNSSKSVGFTVGAVTNGGDIYHNSYSSSPAFAMDGWVRGRGWTIGFPRLHAFQNIGGPNDFGSNNIGVTGFTDFHSPGGTYPSDDNWHYVVLRTAGGVASIWFDGVMVGSAADPGGSTTGGSFWGELYGSSATSCSWCSVAIYSSLSNAAIANHYAYGIGGNLQAYNTLIETEPTVLAYYQMNDVGPRTIEVGTMNFVGNKLYAFVSPDSFPFGLQHNQVGWLEFPDVNTLAGPVFHPFTDQVTKPGTFMGSVWRERFPWFTDGTYGYWIFGEFSNVAASPIYKYAMTGGDAITAFGVRYLDPRAQSGGASILGRRREFLGAPDGEHLYYREDVVIYIGKWSDLDIDHGGFAPTTIWTVFHDFNDEQIITNARDELAIDCMCVDASTGHVFVAWDNGQEGLTQLIDELDADGNRVTTWIPRIARGPVPAISHQWTDPQFQPYDNPEEWKTQGTSIGGAMCAGGGILYYNLSIYWGGNPNNYSTATDWDEDGIWRIDCSTWNTTRTGEDDVWTHVHSNDPSHGPDPRNGNDPFTVSPIFGLPCVGKPQGTATGSANTPVTRAVRSLQGVRS